MKPIDFKERNFIIAENQKGVLPLPVYYDGGGVISCWQLSPEEMAEVQRTGVIYIRNITHGQPLQPMLITGHKSELLPIRPEDIEKNPNESQTATERAIQLINQTEASEKPNDNPKETQKKGLGYFEFKPEKHLNDIALTFGIDVKELANIYSTVKYYDFLSVDSFRRLLEFGIPMNKIFGKEKRVIKFRDFLGGLIPLVDVGGICHNQTEKLSETLLAKENPEILKGSPVISSEMITALHSVVNILKQPESSFWCVVREIMKNDKMNADDLRELQETGFRFRNVFFSANVRKGIVDYKHFEKVFIETANKIINDQI